MQVKFFKRVEMLPKRTKNVLHDKTKHGARLFSESILLASVLTLSATTMMATESKDDKKIENTEPSKSNQINNKPSNEWMSNFMLGKQQNLSSSHAAHLSSSFNYEDDMTKGRNWRNYILPLKNWTAV